MGAQGPGGGFVLAAVPKGPQTHTVDIRELKFQPAVLTVKVGQTIEWKNEIIVHDQLSFHIRVQSTVIEVRFPF